MFRRALRVGALPTASASCQPLCLAFRHYQNPYAAPKSTIHPRQTAHHTTGKHKQKLHEIQPSTEGNKAFSRLLQSPASVMPWFWMIFGAMYVLKRDFDKDQVYVKEIVENNEVKLAELKREALQQEQERRAVLRKEFQDSKKRAGGGGNESDAEASTPGRLSITVAEQRKQEYLASIHAEIDRREDEEEATGRRRPLLARAPVAGDVIYSERPKFRMPGDGTEKLLFRDEEPVYKARPEESKPLPISAKKKKAMAEEAEEKKAMEDLREIDKVVGLKRPDEPSEYERSQQALTMEERKAVELVEAKRRAAEAVEAAKRQAVGL